MSVWINMIEYLISSKKTEVYVTFNRQEYSRVASKLRGVVKYRVATTSNMSSSPIGTADDYGTEYKFYVKKEDEHKATQAIHSK